VLATSHRVLLHLVGLPLPWEDDFVLFLRTHGLQQAERSLQELGPCDADAHLRHLAEDGDEQPIPACPEGLAGEVDVLIEKLLVRGLRQLREYFVYSLFLQHGDEAVGMVEGLDLPPVFWLFGLGFPHGLRVEVLSDGEVVGVPALGLAASVRQAVVAGLRADQMRFLLHLFLAVVKGALALDYLAGDVVEGWSEGQLHQLVLALLLAAHLHLLVVFVEPLEAFCPLLLERGAGYFAIDLLADGVDGWAEGALPHHLLLLLLLLPQQRLQFFTRPPVALLHDVLLPQLLANLQADLIQLGLVLLVFHQVVVGQRILLRLRVVPPQDSTCPLFRTAPALRTPLCR
jgi:hypothetical protein